MSNKDFSFNVYPHSMHNGMTYGRWLVGENEYRTGWVFNHGGCGGAQEFRDGMEELRLDETLGPVPTVARLFRFSGLRATAWKVYPTEYGARMAAKSYVADQAVRRHWIDQMYHFTGSQ